MSEREKLLAKAKRFLQSARLLMEDGDLDSAVSRLYYAVFYVAEALLDAKGLSFTSLLLVSFEKRQMGDYLAATSFSKK